MTVVKGKLTPLRDNVFVTDMEFGIEKTASGLLLLSDDGKSTGVHPRWAKVWKVGPDQHDVKVGDWICVEHGRWTRKFEFEHKKKIIEFRMVDNNAIIMISETKPDDSWQRAPTIGAGSNASFNIPGI